MSTYSAVYWVAIGAAFAFLIVDIFSDSATWNIVVIALVIVAMLARPGGFWGKRA